MKDTTRNKLGIGILSFGIIFILFEMFTIGFSFLGLIGILAFIFLIIINYLELKDSQKFAKENGGKV